MVIKNEVYAKHESAVRSYCRDFPVQFAEASGSYMMTDDGAKYLDFLSGCGSLNYGHNPPSLKSALVRYIERDGVTLSLDMHTEAKASFLSAFQEDILDPRQLSYRVMFTGPTGTNAVEAALKIVRKNTGRTTIGCFTNGFHGMSLGALSVSGNIAKRAGAGVPLNGCTVFPHCEDDPQGSLCYIRNVLENPSSGVEKPAAFIVEAIQGEGGLRVASDAWLRGIASIASEFGILLILDEIQAGVGRSGEFFAFESSGIKPDVVTLAKSLSGYGLPLAITLIKPELDIWSPGEHNGTFRGNNHAFVTGAEAIREFWSDGRLSERTSSTSKQVSRGLSRIAEKIPDVHLVGKGMMQGLRTTSGSFAREVCKRAFLAGLIVETSGARGEVVKLLPPLNIETEDCQIGIDIIERAMEETCTEVRA